MELKDNSVIIFGYKLINFLYFLLYLENYLTGPN